MVFSYCLTVHCVDPISLLHNSQILQSAGSLTTVSSLRRPGVSVRPLGSKHQTWLLLTGYAYRIPHFRPRSSTPQNIRQKYLRSPFCPFHAAPAISSPCQKPGPDSPFLKIRFAQLFINFAGFQGTYKDSTKDELSSSTLMEGKPCYK